jgi:dTDP-glucose pyrophosphorylase
MKYLKNNNITCAVASNSIKDTVLHVLRATGYINYIDIILSNEDVIHSKPSPEIYLKTMLQADVGPTETIIFEDSPTGIKAAELSGAKVIKIGSTKDINVDLVRQSVAMDNKKHKWINKKLNVIIPMAGVGSRFMEAGYTFPKPLIEVDNKPMIQMVVDNLNIDANFTFIVQKDHYNKFALKYLLNIIASNCNIIQVNDVTEGAACTVLLAKDLINTDNPLLIANSDQLIEWDSQDFYYCCENSKLDGTIITFESVHPKWSFVRTDDHGYVTDVAEKKPISNMATVGIYYWNKGKDFVKYAEQMIAKNIRVNNEFYVCPVFNEAILDNKKFKTYNIEKMWGLGTPEDLNHYIKRNQ